MFWNGCKWSLYIDVVCIQRSKFFARCNLRNEQHYSFSNH
jgi:hypothetical protein